MKMGRFDKYNIDLKGLKSEPVEMVFNLDNAFFADIEGEEFQKGTIKAVVTARKNRDVFDLNFALTGVVTVSCDRCLDELDIDVETESSLRVKLGSEYADDGDTVIVPEQDGDLNIAWYLYEFIALSLPMKRVHAPGKCNREMTGKLNKHTRGGDAVDGEETETADIDPRWESLKNIQIEEDI